LSEVSTNTVDGATLGAEGLNQSGTNTGSCIDKAGNAAEPAQVGGINIDKTHPLIAGSRTPAANLHGWNNQNVTVSFTCTEQGAVQSGLATNSVAGKTLATEGASQSVTNTGDCVDKAGNVAVSATVGGINIDTTAPVIDG